MNDVAKKSPQTITEEMELKLRMSQITENTESDRLYNFIQDPFLTAEQIDEFVKNIKGGDWTMLGNQIGRSDRINKGSVEKNTTNDGTVAEVLTNGKDACIELAHERIKDIDPDRYESLCRLSQKDVIEDLFGIPKTGARFLKATEIKQIAKDIGVVTIFDNYTLDVRDFGIGCKPSTFPDTLTSIERGNKIKKFYSTGTYGFGGCSSSSKSFCEYTLFISKAFGSDEVGITLIKYIPPKKDEKDGQYWYLHIDNEIPTVYDDCFHHGTLKRHYETHVKDIIRRSVAGRGNIYTLLRYIMPTSNLPILVHDLLMYPKEKMAIEGKKSPYNAVIGVQEAIEQNYDDPKKNNIRFKDKISRNLMDDDGNVEGKVDIMFAVTKPDIKRKKKKGRRRKNDESAKEVEAYVDPQKPIIFAEGSQFRGSLGNGIFKNGNLHFLRDNIIAIIDLDSLDRTVRSKIYGSNREELKMTYRRKFSKMLQELLEADPELRKLNDEYRDIELGGESEQHEFENKNLLVKFLNLSKKNIKSKEGEPNVDNKKPNFDIPELPDMKIEEPPTILEFVRKKPIVLHPDKCTTITCKTNAHHNYMDAVNSDNSLIHFVVGPHIAECKSREIDSKGRFRIFLKAKKDAKIDSTGVIKVLLASRTKKVVLHDTIQYEIKEQAEKNSRKGPALPDVSIREVDFNNEDHFNMWYDMAEPACYNNRTDDEVKKMVSFMTINSASGAIVLLNVNYPPYISYYGNQKRKRERFEKLVKSKIEAYVSIQFVSRFFNTPAQSDSECDNDVESTKYFYHSNILSNICFDAFCEIENDNKK